MAWMDSMAICGSVLALTLAASAGLAAPEQVDLKLVLAVDVSGSINDEELRVERDGTADAFLNPDVIKAIQSGALGKIAVSMLDCAGNRPVGSRVWSAAALG